MRTTEATAEPDLAEVIDILKRLFGTRRPPAVPRGMAIDVGKLRRRLGLTQAGFARRFQLSPASLRKWEQGTRAPDAAARAYLTVIAAEPHLVAETLSSPGDSPALLVSDLLAALDDENDAPRKPEHRRAILPRLKEGRHGRRSARRRIRR